jgi:hypothetical protein
MCRAVRTDPQSLTNDSATIILFTATDEYDTATMHDTASNQGRITCALAGVYRFTACVRFAADADGYRNVFFRHDGSTFLDGARVPAVAGGTVQTDVSHTVDFKMAANEYMEVSARHTAGASLNVERATFSAVYLGPG